MEEHFWTSGADNARATTATNAVMVFPYPPGILQGDQIWTHLRERTGWRSVVMPEHEIVGILRDAAATHVNARGTKLEMERHRAVAEVINAIIAGGNSVRRL
jgi:hypothetical protein